MEMGFFDIAFSNYRQSFASFSNRAFSSTYMAPFFSREIIVKWYNVIMNDEKWLIGDKIRSERRCQTFRAKLAAV